MCNFVGNKEELHLSVLVDEGEKMEMNIGKNALT